MQISKPIVKREYSQREARGYSRAEMAEAGINVHMALKNGIPLDIKRNSKHAENVEQLKRVANEISAKAEGKPKKEPKAKKSKTKK